jgi:hypothetical protein
VEDGEVGERRARCRRRGGGAISTVPHGWTWTDAAPLLGRSWPALPKSGRSTPVRARYTGPERTPSNIFIYVCSSFRARRLEFLAPPPLRLLCLHRTAAVRRTNGDGRQIEFPLYSIAGFLYCLLWRGTSSHSQCLLFWPCSLL